jgi:HrpA-like RNA helicase
MHSSLSAKEQAKVFLPGPKVILSTNLAETSVTLPDVKVVIDTGRERQFSLLESTEDSTTVVGSQLATVDISQASAKQHAGRAG